VSPQSFDGNRCLQLVIVEGPDSLDSFDQCVDFVPGLRDTCSRTEFDFHNLFNEKDLDMTP